MMNEIIKEMITADEPCSYLEDHTQRMHYQLIDNCSTSMSQALIERGWRRFGRMFFRPVCQECNKCRSLRIDAENFKFSRSQRRILRKNKDTEVFISRPKITQEHINLHIKYHLHKHKKVGWKHEKITQQNYYLTFVQGMGEFAYEVSYIRDGKLIGVDLIDILEDGISAIYFFYDPDFSHLSLGNFSILKEVQIAHMHDLKWIYLGYYVSENKSLNYKAKYQPLQELQGDPQLFEDVIWSEFK